MSEIKETLLCTRCYKPFTTKLGLILHSKGVKCNGMPTLTIDNIPKIRINNHKDKTTEMDVRVKNIVNEIEYIQRTYDKDILDKINQCLRSN